MTKSNQLGTPVLREGPLLPKRAGALFSNTKG